MSIGAEQFYHDPLRPGTNDIQELPKPTTWSQERKFRSHPSVVACLASLRIGQHLKELGQPPPGITVMLTPTPNVNLCILNNSGLRSAFL